MTVKKIRILVVGVGHMGMSHAKAYHENPGFEIIGMVSRSIFQNTSLPSIFDEIPRFSDFENALHESKPDAVSINTWTGTHAEFCIKSLEAGAHVFVEKPLGVTTEEAEQVIETAKRVNRKLVIGYILHHHPSWNKLTEIGKTLGKPLVMRMNLNQQSSGSAWETHKQLMQSQSPIVDCGVHYVDIMCRMTSSKPISVYAIGARLSDEIPKDMYNYGQLQVKFEDGSVGWYEAGWGPMISEVAFFVKDVVGPKGSVSIVVDGNGETKIQSDDVNAHTKTNSLVHHHSELDKKNNLRNQDTLIPMEDEPDHQELCNREQAFFLKAILEDYDLTDHMGQAVDSLKIVLAADQSIRTDQVVTLH